jgi:putative ABC transport system permease protein
MLSPRWKKLIRDLQAARGRMAMMVIAIAVSILGVGATITAGTILTREIRRNYLGTNPASAFVELDRVDDAVVQQVRQRPDIQDAEATSWVVARVESKPGQWLQLLLFVIPDFNTLRIDTFLPESGAWPPPAGTILVEREALKLIGASVGDALRVQTPNGPLHEVPVSGTVHDPGLAPAWQEQTVYGYVTPETLSWLGEGQTLKILKIMVKDQPNSIPAIEAVAGNLTTDLKAQGYSVGEIRIPPPGMHPHQSQMNSILVLLLAFSVMAVILSAILTATMIGGLLAQQVRQIGIMKAIGARSRQIAGLYLALVAGLGFIAFVVGAPLGLAAGRGFANVVSQLLNFKLYSLATPDWVVLVLLAMGTVVPLLVALGPIQRSTRLTVREILNDYGTTRESFGSRGLDDRLSRIRGLDSTLVLAIRNTFRRRGRLILTLGLLAAAGGMFMTGLNVEAGWKDFLAQGVANRRYDLEIRLNGPKPKEQVLQTISSIPGVEQVEPWDYAPAAMYRPDGLDIVRTYPDGGHGSFMLRSTVPGSPMLVMPVMSGRILQASDTDGVVLNQLAAGFFPNVKIGDPIRLVVGGRASTFRLVGMVRQVMTPATAYVLPAAFAQASGFPDRTIDGVRVVMASHVPANIDAVTGQIGQALTDGGIGVRSLIPRTLLEGASDAHVYVLIFSLVFMAAVMAVVGALGLASSMGTSVIERTREFGVMRAIGARSGTILRGIITEGVLIGLMSWLIAVGISIPPSLIVDNLLGNLFSRIPLTLILSPVALAAWLLIVVVGALIASAYPARQASRLTVRETLTYI